MHRLPAQKSPPAQRPLAQRLPTPEASAAAGLLPLARVRVVGASFFRPGALEYDAASRVALRRVVEHGRAPAELPEPRWVPAPRAEALADGYGLLAVRAHDDLVCHVIAGDMHGVTRAAQDVVLKATLARLQDAWARLAAPELGTGGSLVLAARRRERLGRCAMGRLGEEYLGLYGERVSARLLARFGETDIGAVD